jgi:hypothetical protein
MKEEVEHTVTRSGDICSGIFYIFQSFFVSTMVGQYDFSALN